ncbi:MAG: hypothetical protein ABI134_19380 [Byssovorax sp.]
MIAALAFGVAVELDPPVFLAVDPPVSPVVAPQADKPTPAPVEAPRRSFRIGVSPWVDFLTAPRAAFGLSLGLGYRVGWFSLDFEGHWDPPAASVIKGAEVETSRAVGRLVPCGHLGYFAGCLLAEVGPIWGTVTAAGINGGTQAVTYVTASGRPDIYVTVGGRLSAEFEIAPHLALWPAVDLLLPLQRPAFHITDVSQWKMPAASVRVGLGLLASF